MLEVGRVRHSHYLYAKRKNLERTLKAVEIPVAKC